jgi:hypothetical protein
MNGLTTYQKLRNRLVVLIILTSVLLAVASCGSAKHTLENVVVRDTVIVTKERKLIDTLTLFKDTVLYQDRVKVKIEYIDNYVRVEADCPSDTIRITQVKIVQAPAPKPSKYTWQGLLGWSITILAIIVILREVLRGLVKKLF